MYTEIINLLQFTLRRLVQQTLARRRSRCARRRKIPRQFASESSREESDA